MILIDMDYWTIHHRRRGHCRSLEWLSGGIIFSFVLYSVNAGTSTSSYSKQYTGGTQTQSFTQPQNKHKNLLNAAAVNSGNNTSSEGYYATAESQQIANLSPPLLPAGAPGTFEPRGDIGGGYGGSGFGGGGGYGGGGGGGWGGGGGGFGGSPEVYKYQVYPNPVSI